MSHACVNGNIHKYHIDCTLREILPESQDLGILTGKPDRSAAFFKQQAKPAICYPNFIVHWEVEI